ncbi:uncharacterized protein [Pagrus major]|uniref:uncharacterized protein n=1 Tax=Pagrus major TaxID=143350 RepID=UPI003CC86A52
MKLIVAVVQSSKVLTYISAQICAVRGSTVDIRCIYRTPSTVKRHSVTVDKILWFTEVQDNGAVDLRADPEYAGRVRYYCDKTICTLRITDLRESDSSVYKFTFKYKQHRRHTRTPGVILSVTDPDLQVQVRRSYSTQAELFCHSACHLPERPSYIWYKNGQKIQAETSSSFSDYFNPADSYSCAVRRHEGVPAPSVCVYDQTCNRVIYTDRSICAFKGSSVDISCTYSSYETIGSKFWFSPERSHQWQSPSRPEDLREDSQFAGRVQVLETETGRSTLRITDLTESDSAEYHFKFTAGSFEWMSSLPATTLTVTALQVQVIRTTVHQSDTEADLKCHSSCGPAGDVSYVWFKNGQKIQEETSSYRDDFHPGDHISCAFRGHEDYHSPSLYAPQFPSVTVSPAGEIMEGSSVTLTCSSDANIAAKYTWYKKNVNLKPLSKNPQLVFSSIQSSDSGEYYCTAEKELGRRTSEYISINVSYAPKLPSVSVSPSAEIVEGSSVTLTCSSDANPAAKYTWYKENQTLFQGPEDTYTFSSIISEDRGIYYCKSENQYGEINSSSLFIDVQYAPRLPSVSVSPSAEIVEGSSVTLTCSSDANPAANYTWYKENEDSPKASGQIFTITDFRAEHSGNYYCEAQNRRGRHNVNLYLLVVGVKQASHSTSNQDCGGRTGHHNSTLNLATTAAPRSGVREDRSRAVTCVLFVLAFILILSLWIRKHRLSSGQYELGQRQDNRAQTFPRLTCPPAVRSVFSALVHQLIRLFPTHWQTKFSFV